MNYLRRPPRYTFTDVEQIALEWVRIYRLPHDVLYDFKIISQLIWNGEELPWAVHKVQRVQAARQNPFYRSMRWTAGTNFKHGGKVDIEIPTVGLLNEFGEVVAFKDLMITMRPGDTLKDVSYSLEADFDHAKAREYA